MDPEDGGSMFLGNVSIQLQYSIESQFRWPQSHLPSNVPYKMGPGTKARAHIRTSVKLIDSDLSSSATHLEENHSTLAILRGQETST
jgi:hypothetical protein